MPPSGCCHTVQIARSRCLRNGLGAAVPRSFHKVFHSFCGSAQERPPRDPASENRNDDQEGDGCSRPGPTPLHPEVQEALARPIIHHRTDEFRAMFKSCGRGAQDVLEDERRRARSSRARGPAAMEAALVNVLSPGDTMLALVAGNFGERWAQPRQGARHGRAHAGGGAGARPCRAEAVADGARRRIPKIRARVRAALESSHGRRARRRGDRARSRATGRTRCSWSTPSPARAP